MTRRLGFFDGVAAFFKGVRFIVSRPSIWAWAIVPVLVATLLFAAFGAVFVWGGTDLADRIAAGDSAWHAAGQWALRVVFWLIGGVLAFLFSISLAQPLSGFALEAISRQELALGGRSWPDQPALRAEIRALGVTFTALALSLPILALLTVITLLFPPAGAVTIPLKFVVTGVAIAYDFLDYPLGIRGAGVGARLRFIRQNLGAVVGFGVAAATVLLVPGVGLFVLPFGVAGATHLVVRAGAA